MTIDASAALGPFPVLATCEEVAAFRAATGLLDDGDRLPLTFPMRWMASPTVRDAMLSLLPESGLVPVHEGQTFGYVTPLLVGTRYVLRLDARRETSPDRLIANGTIATEEGRVCSTLETILRLFSTNAVAA